MDLKPPSPGLVDTVLLYAAMVGAWITGETGHDLRFAGEVEMLGV